MKLKGGYNKGKVKNGVFHKAKPRVQCGKGDSLRPVDKERYDKNYERIFGKDYLQR